MVDISSVAANSAAQIGSARPAHSSVLGGPRGGGSAPSAIRHERRVHLRAEQVISVFFKNTINCSSSKYVF